tara:strand:+ start:138 stop:476 length:339 start_codon:yes stop_codon:yes gene_type:complete
VASWRRYAYYYGPAYYGPTDYSGPTYYYGPTYFRDFVAQVSTTCLLPTYLLWPYLPQVNEAHFSESSHDRVQALLEASSTWDFNALDLVGPTNNHSLLFLGYWLFVQAYLLY